MSRIRVSAGAIRHSADIAWYDINNYAYRGGCQLSCEAEDRYDMILYVLRRRKEN